MHYLGGLQGSGVLKSGDSALDVVATYDFDGSLGKNDQVTSSGEIRMSQTS